MTFANDRLYVADYGNTTVSICQDLGTSLTCAHTQFFNAISDVSVDDTTAYVTNYDNREIIWKCTIQFEAVLVNYESLSVPSQRRKPVLYCR